MPPPRRAARGGSGAAPPAAPPPGHRRTADGGRVIQAWGVELTVDARKAKQLDAFVRQLKAQGCPPPDAVLALKFLAANDDDAARAATAFAASAAWRARAGLDRPLAAVAVPFEPLLLEQWPQLYLGRDAQARPLVFERPGLFDPRDASGEPGRLRPDDVVAYYCKHLALQVTLLREATAQEGRLVGSMLHVIDVSGASLRAHLSSAGRDIFAKIAGAADAHFPETLGTLLIINASAAFPMFWGVVKAFVDTRTRDKIEVFGDPPSRDFFAPGGWPARVRELCGGRFPEEMFPGRKAGLGGREAPPWREEPWRLLGYKGPAARGAPASPKALIDKGESPKAVRAPPTRGAALLQHGAEAAPQPLPPPVAPRLPPPPAPQTPSPPPPVSPPPPPAPPTGAAGRLIWEMAQKQVQRAQEKRTAPAAPPAGAASGPAGASADDVARWVAAAAAHGGRESWRPPSSLGLRSAPGSPAARRSNAAFAPRSTPPRHAPPPPLSEDEEGVYPPWPHSPLPPFAPPVPPSPATSAARALRAPLPPIAPEVVWAAALSVADDLGDLFSGEGGVDVREGDAEGWACAVCGRRFAFRDLPLAQACEAAHAARGEAAPAAGRAGGGFSAERRRRPVASSSESSSSGDGVAPRPRQASPVHARRSLSAGLQHATGTGKWGGAARDADQAAEARERVAAAGGVVSEWTDAAVLSGDDAPASGDAPGGSPLRAPLSPGTLAAAQAAGMTPQRFVAARGSGRVETSADAISRRRAGCAGVPRASCAPPDAAACVLQ